MSIKLREPLSKLVKMPVSFIGAKNFPPPKRIRIYDDTLRDGEQMAGLAFSPEQKLEIAGMLSKIGVHVINACFPAVSTSEIKSLQLCLIAREKGVIRGETEIQALSRAAVGDIDCVYSAIRQIGIPADKVSLLILSSASDLHLKYKLGKTLLKLEGKKTDEWLALPTAFYRAANIKVIASSISYAREKGFTKIECAAEDASRADLPYILGWAEKCVRSGCTRISFSDTVGCLTPESVDYYFPPLVEFCSREGAELHAHCHNDFGLGAINCVRALSHGVTHAGVTLCGIGERAGNAPMEQVVLQLKLLYGIEIPGFRYDLLVPARKLLEKISGVSVQSYMPVVGEGVFSHESGIHTAGMATHPSIYQFIPEKMVGGEKKFVFGKHSGGAGIKQVLRKNKNDLDRAGIAVTSKLIRKLTDRVKELRENQNGSNIVLGISEAELLELALKL